MSIIIVFLKPVALLSLMLLSFIRHRKVLGYYQRKLVLEGSTNDVMRYLVDKRMVLNIFTIYFPIILVSKKNANSDDLIKLMEVINIITVSILTLLIILIGTIVINP